MSDILSVQSFEKDLRDLIGLTKTLDFNADHRKQREINFEIEHRTQALVRRYGNLMIKLETRHVRPR